MGGGAGGLFGVVLNCQRFSCISSKLGGDLHCYKGYIHFDQAPIISCPLCGFGEETIDHIFVTCPFAGHL